jgi:hypothetical protein
MEVLARTPATTMPVSPGAIPANPVNPIGGLGASCGTSLTH